MRLLDRSAYWIDPAEPFCLDRIDVDTLNDTSPARESGSLFRLPDHVYASEYREQEVHARLCRRCRRALI